LVGNQEGVAKQTMTPLPQPPPHFNAHSGKANDVTANDQQHHKDKKDKNDKSNNNNNNDNSDLQHKYSTFH
jgi:hypothetical protein